MPARDQSQSLLCQSRNDYWQRTPPANRHGFTNRYAPSLKAAVTGLPPGESCLRALRSLPDGGGAIDPLVRFWTNPADAAILSSTLPIGQIVRPDTDRLPSLSGYCEGRTWR